VAGRLTRSQDQLAQICAGARWVNADFSTRPYVTRVGDALFAFAMWIPAFAGMTVAMGFSAGQENLARPNLQTLVRCPHSIVIPAKAGIQTPPQRSRLTARVANAAAPR